MSKETLNIPSYLKKLAALSLLVLMCLLPARAAGTAEGVIGPPAWDLPRQDTVVQLTKAERKRQKKAEKARQKAAKKSLRQDLTRDQQKQLEERVQAVSGLAVGEHMRVRGGLRGEVIDRTADSIATRARFLQALPDSTLAILLAGSPELRFDSLPQVRQLPDSLLAATVADSVLLAHLGDSLVRTIPYLRLPGDSLDGAFIGSGERALSALEDTLPRQRFSITRDTLPAGRHSLYSAVLPGFGQIYNRQTWKLPILYGGVGGFITGGVLFGNKHKTYEREYQRTVDLRLPDEIQKRARDKMRKAGSGQTLMYAAAAGTYLYFVADAVFNYRGPVDPIRKATTLAVVFPGMGFVYTKTYWRLPVYYGGFIALATVVDYNNRNYQRYKRAYDALTDGNPSTVDEFNGRYSPDLIARVRSAYRRDRDFAIIGMAAAYLLSIVDTYVIASLKNWDVSDDIGVRVEPAVIETGLSGSGRRNNMTIPSTAYGMSVKLRF